MEFVKNKKLELAEELAPQIKEVLRRSIAKIAVAQVLLQPKINRKVEQSQIGLEKQRAFDLLNDVLRDLRNEDATFDTIKTLFGATTVLAKFDKIQALNSLEQAVQMINKTGKFNLKETSAPKLGIDTSSSSSATVSTPAVGFDFENAIDALIETDFEQVVSLVERLAARETQGIGRIKTAEIFFRKNKEVPARLNH